MLVGCFPNNARHRTYAKYAEGGALIAGIAISAFANTGADCDKDPIGQDSCRDTAKWASTIGVTLILAGLLGFVATVSTAEDDADSTPKVISVEKATPAAGAGSADGAGTGSAAPSTDTTTPPPASGSGDVPAPTGAPTEAPAAGSAAPATP